MIATFCVLINIQYDELVKFATENADLTANPSFLYKIKRQFEGTCRNGAFIVNIVRIKSSSSPLVSTNLDCRYSLTVAFDADVLIYEEGDLLLTKLKSITGSMMTTDAPNFIGTIHASRIYSVLKPGDAIPFQVSRTVYGFGAKYIAAAGRIFAYPADITRYLISDDESHPERDKFHPERDKTMFSRKFDQLTQLMQKYHEHSAERREELDNTFYPFATREPGNASLADLCANPDKIKSGTIIHRVNRSTITSGNLLISESIALEGTQIRNRYAALYALVLQQYQYIQLCTAILNRFPDLSANANVWQLYNAHKVS